MADMNLMRMIDDYLRTVQRPELSVGTTGPGAPRYGGSVGMPMSGGTMNLEGSYQRQNPMTPPEWSAMLRYNRQF